MVQFFTQHQIQKQLFNLIAKSKRNKTFDKVVDALFQIQGGYALVCLIKIL